MQRTYNFRDVVAAAALASGLSAAVVWFAHSAVVAPPLVFADQVRSGEITLFAAPRDTDGSDESFIFYTPETNDIWVYRDHKFKYRYRVGALGEDMEKIK